MKYTSSKGLLILACFVSFFMLMANALASAGPPIWINQATLSAIDYLPSEDPENSGFGTTQVVVWEEEIAPGIHDIYMKYSLADGALGTWVFPVLHPATTPQDEINPAVTVTNINPINGLTEIHVVYQWMNPALPPQWDVMHTWTNNFGAVWTAPVPLDATQANIAIDPAIVYTEDVSNPQFPTSTLVQFTWAELNPFPGGPGTYEIQYGAYYLDSTAVPPVRGYVITTLIRTSPGGNCMHPEIASIDDIPLAGSVDFYFAIVWDEPDVMAPFNLNVWYADGTTFWNFPPPAIYTTAPNPAAQLNPPNIAGDSYDPDIAVTQDYLFPIETYYFHVNYVYQIWAGPTYHIDECYYSGIVPMPGAGLFSVPTSAQGPLVNIVLDRPTIASKLTGLGPTVFETWMCWEDNSIAVPGPDIWYRVGIYTVGAPPFAYTVPAARVPYLPLAGNFEFNPELWNRNDAARMFPPFTHLVFDTSIGLGGNQEVEYIDP